MQSSETDAPTVARGNGSPPIEGSTPVAYPFVGVNSFNKSKQISGLPWLEACESI